MRIESKHFPAHGALKKWPLVNLSQKERFQECIFPIEEGDTRKRSEMQEGIMSKERVKIWTNINVTNKMMKMFS